MHNILTPLKAAGDLANGYCHRMTLHPGQFTQIGSPKENVIEASVRELECMFDPLPLFPSSNELELDRPLLNPAAYGDGK